MKTFAIICVVLFSVLVVAWPLFFFFSAFLFDAPFTAELTLQGGWLRIGSGSIHGDTLWGSRISSRGELLLNTVRGGNPRQPIYSCSHFFILPLCV